MISKYEFEKLADHVSDELIKNNQPLNHSIKIIAIQMRMNPEQIKRLTESSNIKTYNKMFDALEDKTFTFDVADSKKIIDDVYSDGSEDNSGSKTEIKNMPPVQFDAKVNPKKPSRDFEILGDNDEIEISKNTENSEDSSSDHFLDSLKVPKKDYSYEQTQSGSEGLKEPAMGDSDTESEEDEEKKKTRKEAAYVEFDHLKKELSNRILLLNDSIDTEFKKVASMFRGTDRSEKFVEFVKNAYALYDKDTLNPILQSLIPECRIDMSVETNNKLKKYASQNSYGIKQLQGLVSHIETYNKTEKALSFLNQKD